MFITFGSSYQCEVAWLTRILHITWLTNSCKKQGTTGFFSSLLLLRITPSDQNDELSTLIASSLRNKINRNYLSVECQTYFKSCLLLRPFAFRTLGANKGERAKSEWLVTKRKRPWEGKSPFFSSQLSLRTNLHWKSDVWERGRFKSLTTLV